jgi:hypothetical protein
MKDNRSKEKRQTKEFSGLDETGVWVGAVVSASGAGDGDSGRTGIWTILVGFMVGTVVSASGTGVGDGVGFGVGDRVGFGVGGSVGPGPGACNPIMSNAITAGSVPSTARKLLMSRPVTVICPKA